MWHSIVNRTCNRLARVAGVLVLGLFATSAMAFELADLQRTLQDAGPVQGTFSQARYLKTLPQPLRSAGDFEVIPGQLLVWHVRKPFEQKVRIDAGGLQHWDGTQWRQDTQTGAAGRVQLSFFRDLISGRFESLKSHFSMKLEGSAQAWQLKLAPSSALMKQIFTAIDIAGGSHVKSVRLQEVQGDRMELRFMVPDAPTDTGNSPAAENSPQTGAPLKQGKAGEGAPGGTHGR